MTVKIIFSVAVFLVGIVLLLVHSKVCKFLGGLLLLFWLFLGDWGGLELAKKLFLWIQHGHLLHFIGIIVGFFVAVPLIGKLIPSGGGASSGSSFKNTTASAPKDEKTPAGYNVMGKHFDTLGEAKLYVKSINGSDDWIVREQG